MSKSDSKGDRDALRFFRALPDAPPARVPMQGNISAADKQLNAKIFAFFVGRAPTFASAVGARIAIEEIWVTPSARGGGTDAEAVCAITVTADMVNPHGTLHGACAAYLVDLCSSVPLVALGVARGANTSGVSQSMALIWHAPAPLGTELRIVSNTVALGRRMLTSRCELWDRKRKRLLASAVHTKVPPPPGGSAATPKL